MKEEVFLREIEKGTIKCSELARKFGEKISTMHYRIKKWEKEGIIRGYKGEIDWEKLGYKFLAFVFVDVDVTLLKKLKTTQEELLKQLLENPYVREGYIITGTHDLLLKVIAKDSSHFKEILMKHIQSRKGIVKTETCVVLK